MWFGSKLGLLVDLAFLGSWGGGGGWGGVGGNCYKLRMKQQIILTFHVTFCMFSYCSMIILYLIEVPANKCMLKVYNRNPRKRWGKCSNLTMKTPE